MMAEWELAAQETVLTQTPATTPHKISAVIACYKDWQAIPQMHERLIAAFDEIGCDYEIIFVNDCSPEQDEIAILAASEKDPKVIGISHSRNFGSQNAFLSGMKISSGDAVVLMDGDLQDPPEIIPEMYRKWSTGFDVVYGERIAREAPIHMQFLYKAFYRIFRHLSSVPIPLDAGDFSMMDRKVVNQLLALPESDIFIRGLRAWVGFKQTGIAYKRPERAFGVTTNSFLKNIWWAKKAIFSFSIKPLNYLQGLAISICALSFLLSIFYLIHHIIYPNPSAPGFTTVILVTLCLGGVQLLGISILGDYVGKTLEESKRRPHFIRNRILKNGKIHQSQKEMNWVLRSSENPVADLKS
jgi:glycosyltransferase involved in cell wall biosynthesis